MANAVYNIIKRDLLKGDMDFDTATIHALLVDDTFAVDIDDDDVATVITGGEELAGSGYARETLTTVAVTLDDTGDQAYVDADDLAFGSIVAGETIGGCVVFKFVTDDAGSTPICFLDLTDTATNGQAVSVTLAATGFLVLS